MRASNSHSNRRLHNWLAYRMTDAWLDRNVDLIRGTLFDLGAGEAPYREYCESHCERYVAVDWGQSLHSVRADIIADLNQPLPIASGSADVVLCISVLEHLHEPQGFLSEAARILRDDGALLLQVPFQWWVHEAPHDYFRYTPFALQLLLERAGFAGVDIEPLGGFFSQWALKANYFSARFIRGPRPVRCLARCAFAPFWTFAQLLAPMLDRLDRDHRLETFGFAVTARRRPGGAARLSSAQCPLS
jgi:SAM-dependent methyltransferase